MADYDIRPLQLRILKILLAVDKVCKEHGLRYYIMAGTMLGAVRHKGFIPWDDDLDIGMPRADYDLLMSHSKEWLPRPYEAVCAENDPDYPLPFAKIQDADTTLIERMHLKYLEVSTWMCSRWTVCRRAICNSESILPAMNSTSGYSTLSTATLISMGKVPARGCRCCAGSSLLLPAYREASGM